MSKQYGWMKWGGGPNAHGPFRSYELALADAVGYLCEDEKADITITPLMDLSGEDFASYAPSADDLLCMASESFDDTHGGGDEHMFEYCADPNEAEAELEVVLKQWAKKWVTTTSSWWMQEGEKIAINSSGVVPTKVEG